MKNIKLNKKSLIAIIAVGVVLVASIVGIIIVKAQPKGMVVAVSNLPDSLNPILDQNTSGLNADELIFDGLCNFEVDSETGSLCTEFALAESIEQDPGDRKTYTVTLRDATWHDESPLTADDVVYSYNAYILEENRSPKRDYILSYIKSCEVIDDRTVEIVFNDPMPEFNAYSILTFKIIPCRFQGHDMDVNLREGEIERRFATEPIGTGPFKLESWEIGKYISFKANGLYEQIKNVPQADSLVLKRIIDPIVRINELKKGRVNVVLETNPMDHETVSKISKVDINSYFPYSFYEVAINTKLFKNANGRKAMAMALNKEEIIPKEVARNEEGVILNYGPYPSNLFQQAIPDYISDPLPDLLPYDIQQAKKLAKSGDISGQNANLLYPDSMGEFGKQLAENIAKQLGEIGLNVTVKRTGDQVFKREVYKNGDFDLALMYREGFDNLYSTLDTLYRTNAVENITGISDKSLERMFNVMASHTKTEDWVEDIYAINEKITDLSPALYICSLKKDVYSHGLSNVVIATDNAFLSVEDWKFKE